jgi:hypothetical protein
MNYWLAQLILAARDSNENDKGWMQILVFVILAIFYAVGSIVKTRANKTAPKEKQTTHKPGRKPPESAIDLQMLKQLFGLPEETESSRQPSYEASKPQAVKPQVQPTHRKVARPATARSAPYDVAGVTSSQPAGMAMPQVQPKLEKVPRLTAEVAAPVEIPQAKYLSEILSDYENPESLRRAILHYEILGKPISLREPSEQIIGF